MTHYDTRRGTDHHNAKLTPELVRRIRSDADGLTLHQTAAKYGVSHTAVWKVINHITWKHIR